MATMLSVAGGAYAQSSVTIYGSIDAGVSYVNNQRGGSSVREDTGNRSPDRLGFRGTEDLGDGYKALWQLETGFNVDDGTNKKPTVFFNRAALVGLSGPMGTLTLGHMPDFMYEYLRFQSSGNMGSAYFFHPGNLDNLASQFQLDNAIKYESPVFNGFTLGAMNGFGEQTDGFNKLRSYSFGAKYIGEALNAGLAYTSSNNRAINIGGTLGVGKLLGQTLSANPVAPNAVYANFNADSVKSIGLSASYKVGDFTPHFMYSRIKLETAAGSAAEANYEAGTDYAVTGLDTVGASFTRTTFQDIRWNQYNLINMYRLSKRTQVYIAASYQKADNGYAVINSFLPSNTQSQSVYRVGVHHLF
ncbi:porin [Undibacterium sp. TJN25]|uniref:porin n=1 Tax=Undibacterium sp. TJN25 TaxID=3413056 RepID=UPI003BF29BDD